MGTTTTELRREHSVLVSHLNALATADPRRPEALRSLRELHGALRAHLEREQREVYGPLQAAAQTNRSLALTLRLFGDSTAALTERVLAFFDRYGGGRADEGYSAACGQALRDLRERVRREETMLFLELDRTPDARVRREIV